MFVFSPLRRWLLVFVVLGASAKAFSDTINLRILDIHTKRYHNAQITLGETVKQFAIAQHEALGIALPNFDEVALVFDGHIFLAKDRITSFPSAENANLYYGEQLKDLLEHKIPEVWRRLGSFGLKKKGPKLVRPTEKKTFQRRNWSKYKAELFLKTIDEADADFLYDLYLKHIFPYFKNKSGYRSFDTMLTKRSNLMIDVHDERTLLFRIQNWILHNIYYLGSPYFDSLKKFSTDPYFRDSKIPRTLMVGIKRFLATLQAKKAQDRLPVFNNPEQLKVLILTSSGWGGGHFTVAQSVKEALTTPPPPDSPLAGTTISVDIIDNKEARFKPFDSLWKLTNGAMHSIDIYDEIYQKEHDQALADAFWVNLDELNYYSPDGLMPELKKYIRLHKPDLIISCLHHYSQYIDLAYTFSIPLAIVGTDFGLQGKLFSHAEHLNPGLVNIWAPTDSTLYFKGFHNAMHTWGDYFSPNHIQFLDEFMTGKAPLDKRWEELSAQFPIFKKLGFPIRKEITKVTDSSEVKSYKRDFGIGENPRTKVIMLTMGRQGVGTIVEITKELVKLDQKIGYSLYLFPLCGNNAPCYQTLSELRDTSALQNIVVKPQRLLDASQMNRLYNISDLVVSKPGGATAAELLKVGKKLAAIDYHPWEYDNLIMLKSWGLANDLVAIPPGPQRSAKILETLFKWNGIHQTATTLDWQNNIFDNIARLREAYRSRSTPVIRVMQDHRDAPKSFALKLNGKTTFNLARDFSQDGLSKEVRVTTPPKPLPHLVVISLGTVRRDYGEDPKNAPTLHEFSSANLRPAQMISNATAAQHAHTALFYSLPALYRESLIRHNWSSGSPALHLLKRAGYKIHVFGRPNYYYGLTAPQSQRLFEDGPWSERSHMQLIFGQHARTLLDSYPLFDATFDDFATYSMASGDEYTVNEELPSVLKNHQPGTPEVYLFMLDGAHDRYSWNPELPRDPAYADLTEDSTYNHQINAAATWFERGLQEEVRKAYRNALRNTDHNVARILGQLKEQGLYDDALIVIFSDHGERLYDIVGNWYEGMGLGADRLMKENGHGGPPVKAVSEVSLALKPHASYGEGEKLKEKLASQVMGHEVIFPTLLDMIGVKAQSPKRVDKPILERYAQKSLIKTKALCQISFAPNGAEDPYIFAFITAAHTAHLHFHYSSYLMDEADLSKVAITVDAITNREGEEISVEPLKAEEFFKANFAGCLSSLGVN